MTEPDSFDVIVVGGGPAGSTAAFTAARAGLKTCLVDKQDFPRDKLCGGLITPRTKSLFESIFNTTWPSDLILTSDSVSFFSDNQYLTNVTGYCALHFTMRRDFDAYLVSLARTAGSAVMTGDAAHSIDAADNSIMLSSGRKLRYRALIGADGVNSVVAKSLFGSAFDSKTIGFGLEVEVPRDRLPSQDNSVEIDFGAAKWGYGWVFPKQKTFTIGVGGIHEMNPDLRKRFQTYLQLKNLDIGDFKVKGHYIPFGDCRKKPGIGNIVVCGDAAGVVDPITGEGIAYAIQTGNAAATAVSSSLRRGDLLGVAKEYQQHYQVVSRSIQQADRWRYLIFPEVLRKPFAWGFKDASTLQKGYLDILSGSRGYESLPGLFMLQVAKAVRKVGRKTLQAVGVGRRVSR